MATPAGAHASYIKQYLPTAFPAVFFHISQNEAVPSRPFKLQYQRPAETEQDALLVFSTFKDVRPKMDTYVFNDGSQKTLLGIDGTIPVYYKGISYNIPICIWVMDTHPYNPPLCFVKPTKDMLIKPSKYVNANGKIYLPYLYDWDCPSSDLHTLIQVMSAVFGESPPVFSQPSQPNSPPN